MSPLHSLKKKPGSLQAPGGLHHHRECLPEGCADSLGEMLVGLVSIVNP